MAIPGIKRNRDRFGDDEAEVVKPRIELFKSARIATPKKETISFFQTPVVNTISEVVDDEVEDDLVKNTVSEKLPEEQVRMQLNRSALDPYYSAKMRIGKLEKILEVMPVWKSFVITFTFVLSIFTSLAVGMLSFTNFDKITNSNLDVPLFYSSSLKTWENVDGSLYLFLPIATVAFNIIILRLIVLIYNFDKKYSFMASIVLSLSNLLLVIGYIQLLSLTSVIS